MFCRPVDRRLFLSGAAAFLALPGLPADAATMPTLDEVAADPAIPALGNPHGDVTIAEYVDFQCPVCKLAFIELKKLLAADAGIRLVMKDWPIFGDISRYAARMALAIDDGDRYGRAVDALMTAEGRLSEQRTDAILADAGIDLAGTRASLADRGAVIDALLARNESQARAFMLRGTPALVVGGRLFRHGLSLDELKTAVRVARSG